MPPAFNFLKILAILLVLPFYCCEETVTTATLTKQSFYWACLTVSEGYPSSSWWGAWRHTGRRGAGEVTESSTSERA